MEDKNNQGESGSIMHTVLLGGVLCGVWLVWSGYYLPLIMSFGLGSVLLTLWVSKRLNVIGDEGQPLNPKLLSYIPWLILQIILANIDVLKRILSRNPNAIEPTWIRVPAHQKTTFGKVLFANSITLTPGTVSVELKDGSILVNAVSRSGAEDLREGGEMGQKVCAIEKNDGGA